MRGEARRYFMRDATWRRLNYQLLASVWQARVMGCLLVGTVGWNGIGWVMGVQHLHARLNRVVFVSAVDAVDVWRGFGGFQSG